MNILKLRSVSCALFVACVAGFSYSCGIAMGAQATHDVALTAALAALAMVFLLVATARAALQLRHETARRERSEAQLADVTSHIPAVVYRFLYHDDGRVEFTYVGGNPEPIFGVAADTFIHDEQRAFGTIDARDQAPLLDIVAAAAAARAPMHAEMRMRDIVPERWVATHAVPRRANGAVEFTGYWIDVSEQHRQAAELAAAREAAESATRAKSAFLATMSHEIRTPMHGMAGMLEMLGLTTLDAAQRRLLATASSSADELLHILDGVLDFSRLEADRVVLSPAPVDCRELAHGVTALYAWQTARKGLDVTVYVDAAVAATVVTDGKRLRQVLLNLFSNAVKFTARGGICLSIDVLAATPTTQRLRFRVNDTGVGIPATDMGSLFTPFTQAAATVGDFGGSGLGLSISHRLVELLGGTLSLTSDTGQGTRATIEIDVALADTPMPCVVSSPCPARVPPQGALDILVAEDHATNRELVAAQLERLGHRFRMAVDGDEALAMASAGPVDVLLTDLHMPRRDGVALAYALRSHGASFPIVAMTANAMDNERARCLAVGMDDVVTKPLGLAELSRALTAVTRPEKTFLECDDASWRETFGDLSILPALAERFTQTTRADLACRESLTDPLMAADWVHRIVGGMRIFGPSSQASCAERLENDLRGEHGELAMARLLLFSRAAETYLEHLRNAVTEKCLRN